MSPRKDKTPPGRKASGPDEATGAPAAPWPLSRPLVAASVPTTGKAMVVDANAAEREALAGFLGVLSVESAKASLDFRREGERIRVQGRVLAEVTQQCVLTLEPVTALIDEAVHLVFAPPEEAQAAARAAGLPDEHDLVDDDGDLDLHGVDPAAVNLDLLDDPDALPDPIVNGTIDAGAVMVETIAVALDPYPHAPGATFGERIEDGPVSPFAALSKLKGE